MRTKFLLLVTTSFFMVLALNAQINKGAYSVGGSFNMYNSSDDQLPPDSKLRSLNAGIQIGLGVKRNTVFGLIGSYGFSNYFILQILLILIKTATILLVFSIESIKNWQIKFIFSEK